MYKCVYAYVYILRLYIYIYIAVDCRYSIILYRYTNDCVGIQGVTEKYAGT